MTATSLHIFMGGGDKVAKCWLDPVAPERAGGFNRAERAAEAYADLRRRPLFLRA